MKALPWLLLVACAPSAAPPPATNPPASADNGPQQRLDWYADAEMLMRQGSVAEAWALVRSVPEYAHDAARAKAILRELLPMISQLTERLRRKAEEAEAEGLAAKAVRIYSEIQQRLAPIGELGINVEKRLEAARARLAELRVLYQQKINSAAERLAKGDAAEAYRQLERASELAEDQGFEWTFEHEQRLELARLQTPLAQRAASQQREQKRTRVVSASAAAVAARTEHIATHAEETARLKSVQALVDKSHDLRRRGHIVDAVLALLDAQRKEPTNAAVLAALSDIESDRLRLIDQSLETADRLFTEQKLDKAVIHYRMILRLEPDNLRAREAIRMYENLEQIRRDKGTN